MPINVDTDGYGAETVENEKTWVDARISIETTDTNKVNDPHDFTVTVEENDGTGWADASGVTVSPTISGTGSITSSGPYVTDVNGQVTVTVDSDLTGTATVHATATVTVGGVPINVDTDDESVPITAVPSIDIIKSGTLDMTVVAPTGQADVGDKINYTFTVTNDGNVTLTGVTVADTVGGVTISGGPVASLAPGASDTTTFTGVYTITQVDIDAGLFDNTAEATGTPPVGADVTDTDDESVPIPQDPSIDITKTVTDVGGDGPTGEVDEAGDVISYSIVVENTGNVTLTSVSVSDLLLQGANGTLTPPVEATDGILDIGEIWTYTGSYIAQQSDIDNYGNPTPGSGLIENTATVSSNELPDESDNAEVPIVAPTLTRTQGFWSTHWELTEKVWNGGSIGGNTFPGVSDKTLCGEELGIEEVLGGFWAKIPKTSDKDTRSELAQAKMQLLQQLLAAILNNAAFGSSPTGPISIEQAKIAFCSGTLQEVQDAHTEMGIFNESGDNEEFTPGVNANPKGAKNNADIDYWDSII